MSQNLDDIITTLTKAQNTLRIALDKLRVETDTPPSLPPQKFPTFEDWWGKHGRAIHGELGKGLAELVWGAARERGTEKDSVQLKLTSCRPCPHIKMDAGNGGLRAWGDSYSWTCEKTSYVRPYIGLVVEGDPDPAIPTWCPLRSKQTEKDAV